MLSVHRISLIISWVWILGMPPIGHTQNLLPNPSFEEPNVCHKYEEECCPVGWWSTTPKFVKYHRYHRAGQTSQSFEGKAHMSLLVFDQARTFDRKFIQAPLLCPLVKGETYLFSAYIKTEDFRINQLGVCLSDTLFFAKNHQILAKRTPSLLLDIPSTLDRNSWTRIEGHFTAQGDEQFIIIGNFQTDEQTQLSPIDPKLLKKKKRRSYRPSQRVSYDIDQLSLTPLTAASDCDLSAQLDRIRQQTYRHSRPPKTTPLPPPSKLPLKDTSTTVLIEEPSPALQLQKGHTMVLKNVNFKFGTAILLDASFEELQSIAHTLIRNPAFNILIKGHTDHIGDADQNWRLSKERAKTVYEFLVRKGVARHRMTYKGYGESQPIAPNDHQEGRQLNRRVEIELID